MVYLIHLSRPMPKGIHPRTGQPMYSQHYIGTTSRTVRTRIREHRRGGRCHGNPMLRAAAQRGIRFYVVRLWEGGRWEECLLKRRRNARQLCPRCNKAGWNRYATSFPYDPRKEPIDAAAD